MPIRTFLRAAASCIALVGPACGGEPTNGGALSGSAEVLADGSDGVVYPLGLAVYAGHVYFTDHSADRIARVGVEGGGVEVVTTAQSKGWDVAVAEEAVYWTQQNGVFRVDTPGGEAARLSEIGGRNRRLRVSGEAVHFTSLDGFVVTVPLDGGPELRQRVEGIPHDVAVDEERVYWSDWSSPSAIFSAPLGSEDVGTVVGGLERARGLALHEGRLYFCEHRADGSLGRVRTDGSELEILVPARPSPVAMAVDRDGIFWVEDGQIAAARHDGSGVRVLATLEPGHHATSIATDVTHVYWVQSDGGRNGRVARAPK